MKASFTIIFAAAAVTAVIWLGQLHQADVVTMRLLAVALLAAFLSTVCFWAATEIPNPRTLREITLRTQWVQDAQCFYTHCDELPSYWEVGESALESQDAWLLRYCPNFFEVKRITEIPKPLVPVSESQPREERTDG